MPLLWNKTPSTMLQENCRRRGKKYAKKYVLGLSEICFLVKYLLIIFFHLVYSTFLIPVLRI